ncbi:glutamate--tRNA ligase [Candidatus Daviesbacteria bacterium]|nr:glutamate--tRNA ligase [Candidatus Daviesbacteria bacterium]
MVRVRYAPSPTGIPHVGNIRTALFNYFFAKSQDGQFILRIEDTDRARIVEGAIEAIKESLTWLGAVWDGYEVQSQRLSEYKRYAQQLIEKGRAKEIDGAIIFIVQPEDGTSWVDAVGNKKVEFKNKDVEDFIILKSDSFPNYHLANVVDDHLMGITHVIRGDDWISSTPKHIMLYEAFGWDQPVFAHVPNVLNTDGKKLSKRFGAKSVLDFKKDGYLPEALLNFLALLGWSPKNDLEILSKAEIIKLFKLENINPSPAIFDVGKLDWINGEYIRRLPNEDLTQKLQEFLVDHPAKEKIGQVVPLIKERIKKLSDFIPLTDFLFEKPDYDKEVFKQIKVGNQKQVLEQILTNLQNLERPWTKEEFERCFRKLVGDLKISTGDFFQLFRVAISGQLVTPPLFESIMILGDEETINRLHESIKFLS